MNMPRFTGEASLYKTSQMYRGARGQPAGDAGSTVITQELSCREKCGVEEVECAIGCGLNFGCQVLCGVKAILCLNDCPTGGGVGGTPNPPCPPGLRCCGGFTKVPGQGLVCNGDCIGPGEECP
jgi:hypothetical protein